jgi:hypothetical protein
MIIEMLIINVQKPIPAQPNPSTHRGCSGNKKVLVPVQRREKETKI